MGMHKEEPHRKDTKIPEQSIAQYCQCTKICDGPSPRSQRRNGDRYRQEICRLTQETIRATHQKRGVQTHDVKIYIPPTQTHQPV